MPGPISPSETSALDIIRTETVLSRLPRHILSKSGQRPQIRIEKFTSEGKIDLQWVVSFNELYGPARQLSYDLDTLIVERAVEENFEEARRLGKPLPRLIPLGSLRDLCRRLNLEVCGSNAAKIKRAFRQNAGAVINTVLFYRANDGTEITIDGTFTCYGVFFTGKKLPDGRRADQIYISTTNEYHQVISTAPTRPLDYNYKLQLSPTERRLYEILSFPMYGALKNGQPYARLLYSDYCTRAPHVRYFRFDQVKKQMYSVNKAHKQSGYIESMHFEFQPDPQGNPDWVMLYVPGPRAQTEFSAVHHGKKLPVADAAPRESEAPPRRRANPRQQSLVLDLPAAPAPPAFDPQLIAEFTRRNITESKARELLAGLAPGQDVLAQLEWGDFQIQQGRGKIANPPGFYVTLVIDNVVPPPTFETSAQRREREETEQQRAIERRREQEIEHEYEAYCAEEVERYIAGLDPAEVDAVYRTEWQKLREQYANTSAQMIDGFAAQALRRELRKQVSLPSREEFKVRRKGAL